MSPTEQEQQLTGDLQRKRTVAFAIEELSIGGAEQMLVAMANAFVERGWHVHMICLTSAGELAAGLDSSVSVHVLNKRPNLDLRLPRKLYRCIRTINPLVVNSHLCVANTWVRVALLFSAIPVIATEHSRDTWKPGYYRLMDRLLSYCSDSLVAVSNDTAQFYRDEIGVSQAKMTVINNGVDTEQYAAGDGSLLRASWLGDNNADIVLLGTVGRLVTAKNHPRLLDALLLLKNDPELAEHAIHLVIVGNGPERDRTQEYAASLGLQDVVQFAGVRQDIPNVLAAFDIFVLSSDREGHPLTAMEAQAAGTPVVLTDAGGSADAIGRDGSHSGGVLVEASAAALSEALKRLILNPQQRDEHAQFAREYALMHFDERIMVDEYEALIRTVGE